MNSFIHGHGHKWTTKEIESLIKMWSDGIELDEIAKNLNSSKYAISKMVTRIRQNGIPLQRRRKGNRKDRSHKPWTQEEVEYLVRRRNEKVTAEQMGNELDRTVCAIQAMILKLREEGVSVGMLGQGCRRLWDTNKIKAAQVGRGLIPFRTEKDFGIVVNENK